MPGKTYKGCNSRVISNLLTGDETWVHMLEPQRRADNKQWKGKDQKRLCIAKKTIIVCVEVLRPSQPNGVMSSAVSLPNHTLTGQA